MSLWICPLCGKQNSINLYDPTDFVDDILIILLRGLGKGKGFEEIERYSLRDGSDPELLDLISDRVAVIYDMLYEDVDEEEEAKVDLEDEDEEDYESLSALDKVVLLIEQDEEKEDEEEDEDINEVEEV